MKNYVFDEKDDHSEEELQDEEQEATEEDGFMEGFDDKDEEVEECAECGAAVSMEKKVIRQIEGEDYVFCSKECAEEFEESLGETD